MTFDATTNTPGPASGRDITALISSLWIYVLLNMILRDIHELFRPGFIDELAAGDLSTSDAALVLAGLALQLPLSMVVLSRTLPRRWARPANLAVATITALTAAGTWPKDPDDIVFTAFELAGLIAIAALAWKTPDIGQRSKGEVASP